MLKPNVVRITSLLVLLLGVTVSLGGEPELPAIYRTPANDAELRYWLENMVWHHGFNDAEVMAATGLTFGRVVEARERLGIDPKSKPARSADAGLLVLPYPGGRHPRIGFQDGAVWPQRETKFSVFAPWDPTSYVVVDTPEAIWSNLGLTYLAHTHVPTVWDRKGVTLEPLEWRRGAGGSLELTRDLPNGISFTSRVVPKKDHVAMEMTLTNGTDAKLSDLRVQMCSMLKAAKGFEAQTNDNKIFQPPYSIVRSDEGNRYIIYAWQLCHRPWGNPPCPCLHSDPKFPDCEPGETKKLIGRISFYEGDDLAGEIERIEATGWRRGG